MEARSSGAERSVRTKCSGRMSVSEGWNARPERSEGNARNKLLTFIFPIVIFLIVTTKVTTLIFTAWIRLSAEAVFEENLEVKKMIMQKSAIVHELYENTAEHPLFKVFYLKNIRGSLNNLGHVKGLSKRADFAKPKEFEF